MYVQSKAFHKIPPFSAPRLTVHNSENKVTIWGCYHHHLDHQKNGAKSFKMAEQDLEYWSTGQWRQDGSLVAATMRRRRLKHYPCQRQGCTAGRLDGNNSRLDWRSKALKRKEKYC